MTDRELLELAAKAAGVPIVFNQFMRYPALFTGAEKDGDPVIPWNPLEDDGDALRLAVRLRLQVQPRNKTVAAIQYAHVEAPPMALEFYELYDGDELAATRRAIVRAAAEIGRLKP